MWNYEQDTGRLYHDTEFVVVGYSGSGLGKNNPEMEAVHRVGPTPCGVYKVGPPRDSPKVGKFACDLIPQPGTDTFGRTELMMHGDKKGAPGTASHGCLIFPRDTREWIVRTGELISVGRSPAYGKVSNVVG